MAAHPDETFQFILRAISQQQARTYLIKLATDDGQALETSCSVMRVSGHAGAPFELVQFHSDEFNGLCALGRVYVKPIGAAILAFHACIPATD